MSKTVIISKTLKVEFGLHRKEGTTTCRIIKDSKQESIGKSITSKKDNFCRKTGRKIAFERAVGNSMLPKETKSELWLAMRSRDFKIK